MSAAIGGSMLRRQSSGGEGITDNECNFESASYYLGRNLADDDMAEIEDAAAAAAVDDDANEIPVWVRGEARWIAGVTEHTTAADLVEALILDDRSLIDAAAAATDNQPPSSVLQQYVITERWRQMEQVLESKTKVWKIWKAWGAAQCEVRLRLRKIDRTGPLTSSGTATSLAASQAKRGRCGVDEQQQRMFDELHDEDEEGDEHLLYDSGRESPTTGSAIVRRRRHRASKSTAAWLTQAQTVHPKCSKSTIEKLMSLILEQGETIQHQLTKLRDREIQISQLEEQKHKIREQEHGKNYLLETYLNGLHEAEEEEKDLTTINSDSGVNTEDTQSPNGGTSPTAALEGAEDKIIIPSQRTKKSHFEYTERENELLRDHLKLKLAPDAAVTKGASKKSKRIHPVAAADVDDDEDDGGREMEDEIAVLEKIYAINKHLQKEEELLVRLNAKIKRYESENPNLKDDEILDTLNRLNSEIEQRNREIEITNREIELSDELLNKKSAFLNELGAQLDETFDEEAVLMVSGSSGTQKAIETAANQLLVPDNNDNGFEVNPESIYNISKILLKYSDDGTAGFNGGGGGCGAPETGSDWHNDHRVNLAACHRAPINKTDTNKRIIIESGPSTETGPMSPRHTVTTRVQIHKQPALGLGHNHRHHHHVANSDDQSRGDFIDYFPHPSGSDYHPMMSTAVADFTPVDLVALQKCDEPVPASSVHHHHQVNHTSAYNQSLMQLARQVPGISDKIGAVNSAKNISSASSLMDNKKLATKSFILTSKAYEGLTPVADAGTPPPPAATVVVVGQQLPRCPQTDMTQLGTLV